MARGMEWFSSDPDETVVWRGKPRLRRLLSTVASALLRSAIAVAAAWAFLTYVPRFVGEGDRPIDVLFPLPEVAVTAVWALAGLVVVVQAGKVVVAALRVRATDYVLTDRNVYVKTGVLSENVTRVGVDRVQTTTLRKDLLGNLFDYGTVLVSTAGSGGAQVAVTDLDDPETFQAELRRLVEAEDGRGESGGVEGGPQPAPPSLDAGTAATLVEEARQLRETAERLEDRV